MTAPKDIIGLEDLASTFRNSSDPLEEYPHYGTATYPPADKASRPHEINDLLETRIPAVSNWTEGCEQYIVAHPMQSVSVAAGAGAAAAALLFLLYDSIRDVRC